jgi:hypothetical protein
MASLKAIEKKGYPHVSFERLTECGFMGVDVEGNEHVFNCTQNSNHPAVFQAHFCAFNVYEYERKNWFTV